jgi:hypothetical protein
MYSAISGHTLHFHKLSKDELYERAKKADIPGRSDMSRAQLLKALKAA